VKPRTQKRFITLFCRTYRDASISKCDVTQIKMLYHLAPPRHTYGTTVF